MLIKSLVFVYVRMFAIMFISLLTSSYVFKNLGVKDYGVYSVVGGVVVILAFLNHAMLATSQRYLSLSFGDDQKIVEVFRASKTIHLLIALVVLILGETIGLYFLNHFLTFDQGRVFAVNIAYQFSLLSMVAMVLSAPYMSILLVGQRFDFYAAVGVFEALLKLILAYCLAFWASDRLIAYSVILFFISLLMLGVYYLYAISAFPLIRGGGYVFSLRKTRDMLAFAFWNLLGVFAGLGQNVGVNVLLNIYFRPEINASRALSLQIYNAVSGINGNAQSVYSPLIIKKCIGKREEALEYAFFFSRLSFFGTLLLLIPAYYYLDFWLDLWLKTAPEYLDVFLTIMFIELLAASLAGPLHALIQGEGAIKYYQIVISGLLLLNLPVGWGLYHSGYGPDAIYYVSCFLTILALLARFIVLDQKGILSFLDGIRGVMLPAVFSTLPLCLLNLYTESVLLKVLYSEAVIVLLSVIVIFRSRRMAFISNSKLMLK